MELFLINFYLIIICNSAAENASPSQFVKVANSQSKSQALLSLYNFILITFR